MRFLGIGDTCDLGALYLRLSAEGHEVKVFIGEPLAHGTLKGMVSRVADWQAELPWVGEAGNQGVILFENVADARGAVQDSLRRDGYRVIGGSAFGDKLENDRAYAQETLKSIGLQVVECHEFFSAQDGIDYLASHPTRHVLKFNGPGLSSADNYVGRLDNGKDVAAVLHSKRHLLDNRNSGYILMRHVDGVEMGVGAYFDGENFIEPACLDWEHKRFFPGDMGELTGEMGTVVTFQNSRKFFSATLSRMAPLLRATGYCGYINLNTIVNDEGIWPLEFTCRFGYPGFAVLTPLQITPWGELFNTMINRCANLQTQGGFCVGIVLTIPPFPYDRKAVDEAVGLPIFFDGALSPDDEENVHFGEVGLDGSALVTSGCYGWTMVVTGTGETITTGRDHALKLARRVLIPNLRYRTDIGCKLEASQWELLRRLGWV